MSILLNVEGLKAWYENTQVLYNVGLTVEEGQVISLMGRNGMVNQPLYLQYLE